MTNEERYNRDKASVISMIKYILITLIGIVVIYLFSKFAVMMIPFLIGFILAKCSFAISAPMIRHHEKKSRPLPKPVKKVENKERSLLARIIKPEAPAEPKSFAVRVSILVYVLLLIFTFVACAVAILLLLSQGNKLLISLSKLTDSFGEGMFDLSLLDSLASENGGFLPLNIVEIIKDNVINMANSLLKQIPTFLSAVITAVWNFVGSLPMIIFSIICVILSGYYFINDGHEVTKFYLKNVPNKSFRKKSLSLINDLSKTLFRVIGGYMLLLVVTSVEAWIVLSLSHVDYAVILALITGAIDFLPVLGISATMIPVCIYCFFHGNYTAIVIIIIGMAVMTVIRRVLEPIVLGKTMKLHPLLMLIAMVIGVYVWGPIGFLLGPTVMIIVVQSAKVFEIDKKLLAFLSRVLHKFMAPEESDDNEKRSKVKA